MSSYTPNTPEQYHFRWAVRSLTINDRFVALYDSHATPRSSIALLHDVLGIPEALTALEEVRVDLFEVLMQWRTRRLPAYACPSIPCLTALQA